MGKGNLPANLISPDVERAILGSILQDGAKAWGVFGPQVEADDFALEPHRRLLQILHDIAQSGTVPSLESAYRYVLEHNIDTAAAGLPAFSDIAFGSLPVSAYGQWLRALKRKSVDRQAYHLAQLIANYAAEGYSANAEEILAAQQRLAQLQAALVEEAPAPTIAAVLEAEGGFPRVFAAPRGTIPWPIPTLTRVTAGGLAPGEMWVVGARPSVGKTTLLLQTAFGAAERSTRTQFWSLEMPRADLLRKLFAFVTHIPYDRLRRGGLNAEDRAKLWAALQRVGQLPLEIREARSITDILGAIASTKGEKPELVVIDYLQLVESRRRFENRTAEVSWISRQLKLAALEHRFALLAASQLNRATETQDRPPQLSDLRESGSLEQDADGVLFLHDPSQGRRGEGRPGEVHALLAKQRNGPRGLKIYLRFEGAACRFDEYTDAQEDACGRR